LCNMLGGSRVCVSYARDISPTLILVPVLFKQKETKVETMWALPA